MHDPQDPGKGDRRQDLLHHASSGLLRVWLHRRRDEIEAVQVPLHGEERGRDEAEEENREGRQS